MSPPVTEEEVEGEVLDLTETDDENAIEPGAAAAVPVKSEGQRVSSPIRPQFNNDPAAPKLTIVNGQGFWRSWTRSFRSTILKLLDLIDNSVDGATLQDSTPGFTGRVHIFPDVYEQSTKNRKGKKCASTTGLCIRNNSPRKIVPLSEALVVHSTNKIDESEIGENGVGLKQACAALCDLSFVLVKNAASIELGIVAKSLQREEGPYLPAFQFSHEGDDSLREQMISLFSQPKHDDVAQCLAEYGATISGGDPSLAVGVDGLCKHFDDICNNFYDNEYVFQVILTNIRHDQEEGLVGRALYAQQKITVNQLLKDLQREVPKTYLHIPADGFDFTIGKHKIQFQHWQERLVELSAFTITVGTTIPWAMNFETSDDHPNSYDLRIFIGFDRERIADPDTEAETGEKRENKNLSLHFYSRASGRLIKSELDARHMLGLSTGSSLYASALTVILDDAEGHFPLHPTKQDTAFGLEPKGSIHEENLLAWVSAVTQFYYNFHLKKFKGQKKVLSAKVSQYVDSDAPTGMKALRSSQFTTFELTFERHHRNTIRVVDNSAKEIVGPDTHFRLLQGNRAVDPRVAGRKRSRPENYSDQSLQHDKSPRKKGSRKKTSGKKQRKNRPEAGEQSSPQNSEQVASPGSQEENGEDQNEESNVKVEEVARNNSFDNEGGFVDLCESSEEEGGGSVREEGEAVNERPLGAGPASADASNQPTNTDSSNKVRMLEQALEQLTNESERKIRSLEEENRTLKEKLKRKEAVITVLKKKLGG